MAGYQDFRNKEQADNARAAALNPVTSLPSNGYSKMTQDALRAEIAYLESIRGGSTPGSNSSWRIGEELGMAKLYLKDEVLSGGGGFGGGNLKATPMNIRIGDKAFIEKKFETEDVVLFSKLSGDNNPIHLNESIAADSIFKGRIVHGFLYSSLILIAV